MNRKQDYRLIRHASDLFEIARVTYEGSEPVSYKSVSQLIGENPQAIVAECFKYLQAGDMTALEADALKHE